MTQSSRTVNNRVNKIHEKALGLVFKDETNLSFDELLKKEQISKYSPKISPNHSDNNL